MKNTISRIAVVTLAGILFASLFVIGVAIIQFQATLPTSGVTAIGKISLWKDDSATVSLFDINWTEANGNLPLGNTSQVIVDFYIRNDGNKVATLGSSTTAWEPLEIENYMQLDFNGSMNTLDVDQILPFELTLNVYDYPDLLAGSFSFNIIITATYEAS